MSSGATPLDLRLRNEGEGEAGDGVDLARHQHRFTYREADVLDGHLAGVDGVLLDERLPLGVGTVGSRRAEDASFKVARRLDAGPGQRDDRERRRVVDHENPLDRHVRILVTELDQRVDVGETELVHAAGDARDRLQRTLAGVDGDVQPLVGEVALVEGQQVGGARTFELPVERELDGELIGAHGNRSQRCADGGGQHQRRAMECLHGEPPVDSKQ